MNEKSQPQASAIKDWLLKAESLLLKAKIPSSRLDAELILANILEKNRSYLHAYPEQILTLHECNLANAKLNLRINREPMAYILGYKEFYGRNFIVSPATLIPRPESEQIIETLSNIINKYNFNKDNTQLIDVGTGSGCLGITAKLEFPNLAVTLLDIDNHALLIAKENANKLNADVNIIQSNLLQSYHKEPNIIIANLPYVDESWERSPETNYEPSLALFAEDHGEFLIKKLIAQSSKPIKPNGHLIIEADPTQHESLINYAKKYSFSLNDKTDYIIDFIK